MVYVIPLILGISLAARKFERRNNVQKNHFTHIDNPIGGFRR